MEYIPSHRFPDYAPLGLCAYVVLYEDGTIETVNAVFGRTVGNMDYKIKCGDGSEEAENFTIDDALEEKKSGLKAPTFAPSSRWFGSILYDCVPFSDGETTAFLYEWKNPHPDKKIIKIRAINPVRMWIRVQCCLEYQQLGLTSSMYILTIRHVQNLNKIFTL